MEKLKVLIAIDEGETALRIVETACGFVNKQNAEIYIINVLETTSAEEELFNNAPEVFIRHEAKKTSYADVEAFLEKEGFDYKGISFDEGKASDKILKKAKQESIDLVVIGCNNKNFFEKILIGSTSYKVTRDCKCSVLVVKDSTRYKDIKNNYNVLFAADGSDFSTFAAQNLSLYLDTNRAKLSVINVRIPFSSLIPYESYEYLDLARLLEESKRVSARILTETATTLLKERFDVVSKYDLEGEAASEILKESKSKDYSLIVTGSHGMNELSDFLIGSISSKIYENANKSVLIIKKKKYKT